MIRLPHDFYTTVYIILFLQSVSTLRTRSANLPRPNYQILKLILLVVNIFTYTYLPTFLPAATIT